MKLLVLLVGKAHAGKDTCYDHMEQILTSRNIPVDKYVLADKLKVITKEMIKLLKGVDLPLKYFHDNVEKEKQRPELGYIVTGTGKEVFTIRRCLQTIGTDILRDKFDVDIWIDQAKKYAKNNDDRFLVIPDCRFTNEIPSFAEMTTHKVISIKINRTTNLITETGKDHQTEKNVDVIKCDYVINNDSDLNSFHKKIETVLSDIKESSDIDNSE
jgi:dephospho-CoA kinase